MVHEPQRHQCLTGVLAVDGEVDVGGECTWVVQKGERVFREIKAKKESRHKSPLLPHKAASEIMIDYIQTHCLFSTHL